MFLILEFIMKKITILVSLLFLIPALANEERPYSYIKINEKRFPNKVEILKDDLAFLDNLKFSNYTPLYKNIIFENSAFEIYKSNGLIVFTSERIKTIKIVNFLREAIADNNDGHIRLHSDLFFNSDQIFRIGILLHEARHSDGGHNRHYYCPVLYLDDDGIPYKTESGTKLSGKYACDKSPYGSVGIEIIFYSNVVNFCTNCSSEIKERAFYLREAMLRRISVESTRKQLEEDFQWKAPESN